MTSPRLSSQGFTTSHARVAKDCSGGVTRLENACEDLRALAGRSPWTARVAEALTWLSAHVVPPAAGAEPGPQADPAPAPVAPSRRLRVAVVVHTWIPSLVIGVLAPLSILRQQGRIELRLVDSLRSKRARAAIKWSDVVVFDRSNERRELKLLYEAKINRKRVIYEIDDNFLEIPQNTPAARAARRYYRLHVIKVFMQLSDLVRVYSPLMLAQAREMDADAVVAPTYFDRALIANRRPPRPAPERKGLPPVVRIAYPSARTDEIRLERMLYEALRQILMAHEGRVELHLWRQCPPGLLGLKGVVVHPVSRSYDGFMRSFHALGIDIGLAPLLDEPFYNSKTNLKYRDLGGCGVAGVYSDCVPYAGSVVHERTGLLTVNSVEAWCASITRLIEDADLRRALAAAAREDVHANYRIEKAVEAWDAELATVMSRPPRPWPWLYAPGIILSALVVGSRASCMPVVGDAPVDRGAMFADAVAAVGGRAIRSAPGRELVKALAEATDANLVLFLVDTADDLRTALSHLSRCNSAVLDISFLAVSASALSDALAGHRLEPGLSLVTLAPQEDDPASPRRQAHIAAIRALGLPLHIVGRLAPLEEMETCLTGYPAAYLDVIERHMHFGRGIRAGRRRKRFRRFAAWCAARMRPRLDRLRRRLRLLAWRLGLELK